MRSSWLIPAPTILEASDDAPPFVLEDGLSIVLSHGAERGEWLGAQQIQTALHAHGITVQIQPQIRCPSTANSIVLAVRGRDAAIFLDTGATQVAWHSDEEESYAEAYELTIQAERVMIWGESSAGLVRGVQTLRQLLASAKGSLVAGHIEDGPALSRRGILLDISRGKVPTLDTLKQIVDLMAFYKLNMLQLYVEHTFVSRRHPHIGPPWGGLTAEEIVALDSYCRDRYIELVPCLQSFGHLRRILEMPEYAHLAESTERWSLSPVREESYALLNDLYADFLACFTSPYFNICSDETYDLGQGQSKDRAEKEGIGRIYLEHILKLHELARSYGRTIMVWDDIFLHYPELVNEIPKDIVMLNWAYEAADSYPQITGFTQTGLRQIVCPGTSSWNTLFPRLANARTNTRILTESGLQAGAMGTLVTDWGDGGHPNYLGVSWYGFAYAAQQGWTLNKLDDQLFEERFSLLHFGPNEAGPAMEAMRLLTNACTLPTVFIENGSLSRELFFTDSLKHQGCTDISIATLERMNALAKQAQDLLAPLHGSNDEAKRTLAEMQMAAAQIAHAAERTIQARQLALATNAVAHQTLERKMLALKRELHGLRREHERLWLMRNKPEGLWLTLDRFDRSAQTLDAWLAQLKANYYWET